MPMPRSRSPCTDEYPFPARHAMPSVRLSLAQAQAQQERARTRIARDQQDVSMSCDVPSRMPCSGSARGKRT